MDYREHLNYEKFDSPVCFRVTGASDEAMIPSYEIEANILDGEYGLTQGATFDVALEVGDPGAEFAFDATAVEDAEEVIESVRELIKEFNKVPDDFSIEERDEFKKNYTVQLDDVTRP